MRTYVIFGSNDKVTLKKLGEVQASTHAQAQNKAREQDDSWLHYASTTKRNLSFRTPTVTTVVTWADIDPGQLSLVPTEKKAE